jgi:small subunit ribosomal protein S21
MQREGVFRDMKLRGHYEKPSERRVRQKPEGCPLVSAEAFAGRLERRLADRPHWAYMKPITGCGSARRRWLRDQLRSRLYSESERNHAEVTLRIRTDQVEYC